MSQAALASNEMEMREIERKEAETEVSLVPAWDHILP